MIERRTLDHTNLSDIERDALVDLRARLSDRLDFVDEVILFGSAARGTATPESDIDLLVLTIYPLSYQQRHQITHMLSDINDLYETNFSSFVIDRREWEEGLIAVLPIKHEIERDGVAV